MANVDKTPNTAESPVPRGPQSGQILSDSAPQPDEAGAVAPQDSYISPIPLALSSLFRERLAIVATRPRRGGTKVKRKAAPSKPAPSVAPPAAPVQPPSLAPVHKLPQVAVAMPFERKLVEVRRYFGRMETLIDQDVADDVRISLNRLTREFDQLPGEARSSAVPSEFEKRLAEIFSTIKFHDPYPEAMRHIPLIDFPDIRAEALQNEIERLTQKTTAELDSFETKFKGLVEPLAKLFKSYPGGGKIREALSFLDRELSSMREAIKGERPVIYNDVLKRMAQYEEEFVKKIEVMLRLFELANRPLKGKKRDLTRECAAELIKSLRSSKEPFELFNFRGFVQDVGLVMDAARTGRKLDPEKLVSTHTQRSTGKESGQLYPYDFAYGGRHNEVKPGIATGRTILAGEPIIVPDPPSTEEIAAALLQQEGAAEMDDGTGSYVAVPTATEGAAVLVGARPVIK